MLSGVGGVAVDGVCVEAIAEHGVLDTRRVAAWWALFNGWRCHARWRWTKHTPTDLQADEPNLHMCIMGVLLCMGVAWNEGTLCSH